MKKDRRKKNKIMEDADLILEVSKKCRNYSEIVEKTGISINKVRTSVKKTGIIKQVRKNLLENRIRKKERKSSERIFEETKELEIPKQIKKFKVTTLHDFKDGYITLSPNPYKYVEVVSAKSKICYSKGKYRLNVGDEIFIAQKNEDNILILKFMVINLNDSNNVVELKKNIITKIMLKTNMPFFTSLQKNILKQLQEKFKI